ncbi:MAG: nitrate- and nitrite sensing domain-containing protein [Magnetococcales bacterium]|nr:nitrate- and nitrite sensing domain-containing protein [Magnetococcales bacterium]
MQFLNDLSQKAKITLTLLIVSFALLCFFAINLMSSSELSGKMQNNVTLGELGVRITLLLHETQEERGMTAGYLGSGGVNFASELPKQRELNTDLRSKELRHYIEKAKVFEQDPQLVKKLSDAIGELEVIEDVRQRIDKQTISTGKAVSYYSKMNKLFINSVAQISYLIENIEVSKLIAAYSSYIHIKEFAGLERAVMTNTFARDSFGMGMLAKFQLSVAEQNLHIEKFNKNTTDNNRTYSQNRLSGSTVDELKKMRRVAFSKSEAGGFAIDPNIWFKTSSSWIELLKEVEDHLSKELIAVAGTIHKSAKIQYENYLIFTIVSSAVTLFLTVIFASEIKNSKLGEHKHVESGKEIEISEQIPVVQEVANSLGTTAGGVENINRLVTLATESQIDLKNHQQAIIQGVENGHNFFLIELKFSGDPAVRKIEFDKIRYLIQSVGKVIATDPENPESGANFIKDNQSLLLVTVLEKDLLLSLVNLPENCVRNLVLPETIQPAQEPAILTA